ncbi:hypothetical protein D1F64_07785 [Breoghania sp. L-A4]|nr:hypothetical protein D1F64_07785 [Breoghania sp. L-A4]
MVDRSLIALKVRSYLEGLSGRALAMLVRGLEAARENGVDDPQSDVILEAARALIRKPEADGEPDAHRRSLLKRAFFAPLRPFLISEVLDTKAPGRIYRPSLDAIWLWLERDIAPDAIIRLQKELAKRDFKEEAVDKASEALRAIALKAMRETLDEAAADTLAKQKVAYRVGGDDILAELEDVHAILDQQKEIAAFADGLSDTLDAVDLRTDDLLLAQAKEFVGKDPRRAWWLAALLLARAEDPAWLVAFATRAARSSKANLIHKSPYRPLVDALLAETQRLTLVAQQARGNPSRGAAMVDAVRGFGDLVRDLNIETRVDDVAEWREQLAKSRADMAAFVTKTLNSAVAELRRAMQIPPVDEDGRFVQDTAAVNDAAQILRLLLVARNAGEALAVSELARRLHQSVEQVLDIGSRALADKLREATGDHRRACLAALNASIDFCTIYFGDDYARRLRERRDKLCEGEDLSTADEDGLFADTPRKSARG